MRYVWGHLSAAVFGLAGASVGYWGVAHQRYPLALGSMALWALAGAFNEWLNDHRRRL